MPHSIRPLRLRTSSTASVAAICIINAHPHFEFPIGNDEIMQKMPLKSVICIRNVPFILHIAVAAPGKIHVVRIVQFAPPVFGSLDDRLILPWSR